MKELSIEEKAKAYDSMFERLKEMYNNNKTNVAARLIYERYFPELKESEDDKVRKKLIHLVKKSHEQGGYALHKWESDEMLAWLEKQGEQKCTAEEVLIKAGLKPYKDGDQWCILLGDNIQEGICGFGDTIDDALYAFLNDLIKSQKEQKPVDKAEPKFKVGDWIISNTHKDYANSIMRIQATSNNEYLCKEDCGQKSYTRKFIEDFYHLWTIQDANDGDILFTSSTASNEIFIFESIDKKGNAKCYFAYDSEDGFRDGKYHFIGSATKCKPATKEQRDLLFQKMKEAELEWDAEKKELKIIDQEQVIDYPDNLPKDNWELVHEFVNKFGRIPKDEDELNVLVEYVLKRQKPAEWSEDDERRMSKIMHFLESQNYFNAAPEVNRFIEPFKEEIDWLKSLKDRVQPKQKWDKEDEDMLILSIKYLEDSKTVQYDRSLEIEKCKAWLKSLKPKNRWKPSLSQLNALGIVAKGNAPDDIEEINSLYNDLKKL